MSGLQLPCNPYDDRTLAEQLEQTRILQGSQPKPTTALADLGYCGVDAAVAPVKLIYRGKYKMLSSVQRRWLKHRQAVEPCSGA
ncbi:hypothetical protein [Burkholderia ubonensis]|uniref:hypothetical protein n=1 Tax=Burkholderia ubonensis TaxID=101571 RepID=UPI00075CAF6A|nr:hypothetical protein [Burkholderia ubonensis]KVQ18754.1 hypothetical protein WK00_28505 [Burkholderia ubonensis]